MSRPRWGWAVLLLMLLGSAELGASKQRNKSSRALKKLLIRRAVASKQRSNPLLDKLVISSSSRNNNMEGQVAIVGRLVQILAMPHESNNNEIIVRVPTDTTTPAHKNGARRALKMGSSDGRGQRTGRYRKPRYRSGKGKEKKSKSGMKGGKGGKGGMSKGKGGSGGGSGKSGGGKGSMHDICDSLDFGSFYGVDDYGAKSVFGKGKSGKSGKGKSGRASSTYSSEGKSFGKGWRSRGLQFDGELCAPNAFEVAKMDPDLSIFVDLVEAVNLADIFLCAGPFTVLAPSNRAFQENPDLLTALFNPRNVELVQEMILYHIIPGLFLTEDLVEGPIQTLLGDDVDVALDALMFNQAGVSETDILACNGVIDIIDDLLIPPDSPILPEVCEILDFRVEGQFPTATRFSSLFDHRSLQQQQEYATTRHLQYQGERCQTNILDTARQHHDLSTFVELVEAADLDELFWCAGPFTVLAPVNDAFADVDEDLLKQLLRPERKAVLQEILLYHFVPNYQLSSSFQPGPTETLLFETFIQVKTDPLEFNDAGVVTPDIGACNGVIHKIDTVLFPDSDKCDRFDLDQRRLQDSTDTCDETLLDVARDRPELSTVVALIEAAGLEDLFDCGDFTGLLPNNDAFDQLDDDYVEFLMDPSNSDELEDLLLYHFIRKPTMSDEFVPGPLPTLLSGESVDVRILPLRFDEAGIVTPDIVACKSVIHVINDVLTPYPLPTQSPTLTPTTAPTPTNICEEYTFNRRVRRLQDGGANCDKNVLDTALGNAQLTIVTTLIELAGLSDIFSCPGPFTALLPSNFAFDDVPEAFLEDIVLPQNIDRLRNLLLYHILPGATQTTEFTAGPTDTLFDGNQVNVALNPLTFNGHEVLTGDIEACNGIVHIIGGLLNPFPTEPPSLAPTGGPTAAPVTGAPTLAPNMAPVTKAPTLAPVTEAPSVLPSLVPTGVPNMAPVTNSPTLAPVTEAPTGVPQPTAMPVQRLRIRDFYIAFVADDPKEPTEEQYQEMLQRVEDHFVSHFKEFYKGNPEIEFLNATTSLESTLYEAGIPEPRYNIYMNFDFTELTFTEESAVPTTSKMFELMKKSISTDFILDSVRTFEGSPFESVSEAWFSAVEKDAPDPDP